MKRLGDIPESEPIFYLFLGLKYLSSVTSHILSKWTIKSVFRQPVITSFTGINLHKSENILS
ncbi:hypothetical protein DYD21_02875 [Rhodohalobacter sp. SW132]|nr:hypothetical protein DYD21_02875 [Rhodohalobacter sp. SW132]